MRILYGVVGEGMGHATRSRVVIDHLVEAGHEVEIVVSGRAHDMLARHFEGVHRIHGLTMVYADNAVKRRLTALANLAGLDEGLPRNVAAYAEVVEGFAPEVVISDFESWSYLYGQSHRLPIVSIDNMQIINRTEHDPDLLAGHEADFGLARGIVKAKLPGCRRYFITTFFFPPLRKERTTLVPPILRPEVLAARPEEGEHVLVYQTSESFRRLPEVLRGFPDIDFLIYGLRRDLKEPVVEDNLVWKPFSEAGFIADLASARAVLAGGGFSLMSECVYLGKPLCCVPIENQFEQVLNALYLERLGYGLYRQRIAAEDVAELLDRSREFAANLRVHRQDGNRALLTALDEELTRIAAESRPAW